MSDAGPPRGRSLIYGAAALVLVGLALYGLSEWFQLESSEEAQLRAKHGSAVLVSAAVGLLVLIVGAVAVRRRGGDSRGSHLAPAAAVAAVALLIPVAATLRALAATSPDDTSARLMDRFELPAGLHDPRTQHDPAEKSIERVWTADRPQGELCPDLALAMARWAGKPGPLHTVDDGTGACEYRALYQDRMAAVWVGEAGVDPDTYVIVNLTVEPCDDKDTRCTKLKSQA